FLTLPLHLPAHAAQTVEGHLVYTPVAIESPPPGPTPSSAAPLSGATVTVGATANVSQALDSYQGEPMVISFGARLVGGYNSIYPGACSASAANCAPTSATAFDGITWVNASLPLT